ncbi:MAG: fumarate reductase/succinate dehydrogenase flavoprotein subunit [Bacteroidales bacterium]|nr:fumarate reductase/succinate dehydrogenase flavoprotein subunit [Bacteroidales bacterium]
MSAILDAKIPEGLLEHKWTRCKESLKAVSPANRGKMHIIVVGTGLAGASAAAALGEQGYRVNVFCMSDSPRRAHSVSAQGGINAAKNYRNDNDSVERLFMDTLRGGDFRSREANVYRLAQVSNAIIDHCVALGVPFARDYGGYLDNRSFGGSLVSRTFYARGQTGQQLLLAAYSSLNRQVARGKVTVHSREQMMELVTEHGRARGIITRDMVTGRVTAYPAHAVVLASGGYGNVYYLSTNAMNSNGSALVQCWKKGALFANPGFVQIHPTCIPVHGQYQSKLTLMSESLRNHGRIWVPAREEDVRALREGRIRPSAIEEENRDYYLERRYPAYGNLVPRDVASRAARERCDAGMGVSRTGRAVYLDLTQAIEKHGKAFIESQYGNLLQMYEKITGEDPWKEPMQIYPAIHYTMGGLWVDYHLMTTVEGLFAIGEANFSDHGANRLGASALMQGLADGFFILPYTLPAYLADKTAEPCPDAAWDIFMQARAAVRERIERLMDLKGRVPVDTVHRRLGDLMWEGLGIERSGEGLTSLMPQIESLEEYFRKEAGITGNHTTVNQELEKAIHLEDYFTLARLMQTDALHRKESCGGHFRVESQSKEGETLRDDSRFSYVAAWEYRGEGKAPLLHKEPLVFDNIKLTERKYR